LLGLAIGDALGTTLEFQERDTYEHLTDMVGGGPFNLKAGQWTDDTSMALAFADSLLFNPELDSADLMDRFIAWRDHGEYLCGCPDIGRTVSAALARYQRTGDPYAGSSDPMSAGNGSLMRLAPVVLAHWHDRERLIDVAARQSRTTHAAPEAVDACKAFACVLAEAIIGRRRCEVLAKRERDYVPSISSIMMGSWRGKRRDQIRSSGYVVHSLEAAMWCVAQTTDFASTVLLAANLGEEADSTAAVTGQLAGALYGLSSIPEKWLTRLAWRARIVDIAQRLFAEPLAQLGGPD
jgi:ADP-ribosyl-[dinitrogen reductase] hydrolase